MNARPDCSPVTAEDGGAETGSDAEALWADWLTIWQSELAALAADREAMEASQRAVDQWAAGAARRGLEPAAGPAGAAAPPGPEADLPASARGRERA